MATYRMGLGPNLFAGGPDDAVQKTVTDSPANLLVARSPRVLLALVCNEPAAVGLVSINFDADAQDPVSADPDGFILIPRARPAAGFPMWSTRAGGWLVWGPGGDFPFCPAGRVSARTETGLSVKVWIREILDPRLV